LEKQIELSIEVNPRIHRKWAGVFRHVEETSIWHVTTKLGDLGQASWARLNISAIGNCMI